jgi:type VI secretion system protein ImpE
MQQAECLYRDGKLAEAIGNLQTYLRDHPSEKKARNFLFELLCFAGEFERARKQLAILAEGSKESQVGATYYLAALAGETERQSYYLNLTAAESPPVAGELLRGTVDGRRFEGIADLDARLGQSLEFLASGSYHRLPFRHLKRLELTQPTRVRDLYWLPANAETTAELGSQPLESILIPVLYPQTYLFDDDLTRLGRTTDFAQAEDGSEIPCGLRIWVIGGEEVPILSVRNLEFDAAGESGSPNNG